VTSKKGLGCVFLQTNGAMFRRRQKTLGAILPGFSRVLPIFSGFCPDFHPWNLHLLHQWVKMY